MSQAKPNITPPAPPTNIWWRRMLTLALSIFGTAVFWLLNLPLPFLFGSMTACLIAALSGMQLAGIAPASKASRTVLGVAVGASVTPLVLSQIPNMAGSVAFVPLYIISIGLVGVPFFRRVCGFDLATSYFAAMPGGLQDMISFGEEAGADVRALSLIHATRVLVIVALAPMILAWGFDAPLTRPIGEPANSLPIAELALMVGAAILGWKGAERVGLFGAPIIGPLIVAAILSLTGILHHRPPSEAIQAAQFFIGMGVGVGYVGVTIAELRRVVASGAIYVVILAVLAAIFTEIVVALGLAHPVEGFLSFAPGGQAEMTVLAIVAGADLGFVVVHHLVRILLVITGAPIIAAMMGLQRERRR